MRSAFLIVVLPALVAFVLIGFVDGGIDDEAGMKLTRLRPDRWLLGLGGGGRGEQEQKKQDGGSFDEAGNGFH